jgi:ABC-type branched-subunit amino acid transport system substrate-binding protein
MNSTRRRFITNAAAMTAATAVPAIAQQPSSTTSKSPTVAQIVDLSPGQIDVSKDFLAGSRTAWQEINAKGGLRGKPVKHWVVEVDGTSQSLREAVKTIKTQSTALALFGTIGAASALEVADLLRREAPDLAHIAPWLHQPDNLRGDNSFAIFASRQTQIEHAVKSLSNVGVKSLGAVYATPAEFANYRDDMEQIAKSLGMKIQHLGPVSDLQALGKSMQPDSPRILIFMGGTPELFDFTQGVAKTNAQRYIIAMADVNLQTLAQLGGNNRKSAVIATQVVPMVTSNMPIVRNYRDALSRYLDEPPTSQSLAGYIAAHYTFDALQGLDGGPSRSNILAALQKRRAVNLAGFQIDIDNKRLCGSYVTQSMISADGKLIG